MGRLEQRPGPLFIDGGQDQIGGGKVGREVLGVTTAFAKRYDRPKRVALPETEQGFIAQFLRIGDMLDQQDTFQ